MAQSCRVCCSLWVSHRGTHVRFKIMTRLTSTRNQSSLHQDRHRCKDSGFHHQGMRGEPTLYAADPASHSCKREGIITQQPKKSRLIANRHECSSEPVQIQSQQTSLNESLSFRDIPLVRRTLINRTQNRQHSNGVVIFGGYAAEVRRLASAVQSELWCSGSKARMRWRTATLAVRDSLSTQSSQQLIGKLAFKVKTYIRLGQSQME